MPICTDTAAKRCSFPMANSALTAYKRGVEGKQGQRGTREARLSRHVFQVRDIPPLQCIAMQHRSSCPCQSQTLHGRCTCQSTHPGKQPVTQRNLLGAFKQCIPQKATGKGIAYSFFMMASDTTYFAMTCCVSDTWPQHRLYRQRLSHTISVTVYVN